MAIPPIRIRSSFGSFSDFFRKSCSFSISMAALASNCICLIFAFSSSSVSDGSVFSSDVFVGFITGLQVFFQCFHTIPATAAMLTAPMTVTPTPMPQSMLRQKPQANSSPHFRRSFPHRMRTMPRSRSIQVRMRFSVSVNFFDFVSNSPYHL